MPTYSEYNELSKIARALDNVAQQQIDELQKSQSDGTRGWEREDAEARLQELAALREAKTFTEALITYADKKGQLTPSEKIQIGSALASQPNLQRLNFSPITGKDTELFRWDFSDQLLDQVHDRIESGGNRAIDIKAAADSALKNMPPTPEDLLRGFLEQAPAIQRDIDVIRQPFTASREAITGAAKNAYQDAGMIETATGLTRDFQALHNALSTHLPNDRFSLEKSMRKLVLSDNAPTPDDIANMQKLQTQLEQIPTEGMNPEQKLALKRLTYLAAEINQNVQNSGLTQLKPQMQNPQQQQQGKSSATNDTKIGTHSQVEQEQQQGPSDGTTEKPSAPPESKQPIIVDERGLFETNTRDGGVYTEKKGLGLGITNNTGRDLHFDVVLKDGTTEVERMTWPAGSTAVIQPNGEINLPLKNGKPAFGRSYDAGEPYRDVETAQKIAQERGLAFTGDDARQRAMAHLADKNGLTLDSNGKIAGIDVAYYPAKGKYMLMRLPDDIGEVSLPKTSWGQVQNGKGGDLIVYNTQTDEYYVNSKTEGTLPELVDPHNPARTTQELYDSIPVISKEKLEAARAITPPGIDSTAMTFAEQAKAIYDLQAETAKVTEAYKKATNALNHGDIIDPAHPGFRMNGTGYRDLETGKKLASNQLFNALKNEGHSPDKSDKITTELGKPPTEAPLRTPTDAIVAAEAMASPEATDYQKAAEAVSKREKIERDPAHPAFGSSPYELERLQLVEQKASEALTEKLTQQGMRPDEIDSIKNQLTQPAAKAEADPKIGTFSQKRQERQQGDETPRSKTPASDTTIMTDANPDRAMGENPEHTKLTARDYVNELVAERIKQSSVSTREILENGLHKIVLEDRTVITTETVKNIRGNNLAGDEITSISNGAQSITVTLSADGSVRTEGSIYDRKTGQTYIDEIRYPDGTFTRETEIQHFNNREKNTKDGTTTIVKESGEIGGSSTKTTTHPDGTNTQEIIKDSSAATAPQAIDTTLNPNRPDTQHDAPKEPGVHSRVDKFNEHGGTDSLITYDKGRVVSQTTNTDGTITVHADSDELGSALIEHDLAKIKANLTPNTAKATFGTVPLAEIAKKYGPEGAVDMLIEAGAEPPPNHPVALSRVDKFNEHGGTDSLITYDNGRVVARTTNPDGTITVHADSNELASALIEGDLVKIKANLTPDTAKAKFGIVPMVEIAERHGPKGAVYMLLEKGATPPPPKEPALISRENKPDGKGGSRSTSEFDDGRIVITTSHADNTKTIETRFRDETIRIEEFNSAGKPAASPSSDPVPSRNPSQNPPSYDTIIASIRKENLLGQGGNASVFKVDGHPDIVVRLPHRKLTKDLDLDSEFRGARNSVPIESALGERNFGQPIHDFGDGITVNYRQGGEPPTPNYGLKQSLEIQQNHYEKKMQQAAEMPVAAYKQLLLDAKYLNETGFGIDPKGSNILIDADAQRFNLIDTQYKGSPQGRMSAGFLGSMLEDNKTFIWMHGGKDNEKLQKFYAEIESKMAAAAADLGIEYKKPKPPPPPHPIKAKTTTPKNAIGSTEPATTIAGDQSSENKRGAGPVSDAENANRVVVPEVSGSRFSGAFVRGNKAVATGSAAMDGKRAIEAIVEGKYQDATVYSAGGLASALPDAVEAGVVPATGRVGNAAKFVQKAAIPIAIASAAYEIYTITRDGGPDMKARQAAAGATSALGLGVAVVGGIVEAPALVIAAAAIGTGMAVSNGNEYLNHLASDPQNPAYNADMKTKRNMRGALAEEFEKEAGKKIDWNSKSDLATYDKFLDNTIKERAVTEYEKGSYFQRYMRSKEAGSAHDAAKEALKEAISAKAELVQRGNEMAFGERIASRDAYPEMMQAMKRMRNFDGLGKADLSDDKFLKSVEDKLHTQLHAMIVPVDLNKMQRYNKPVHTGPERDEMQAAYEQVKLYRHLVSKGHQPVLGLSRDELATMKGLIDEQRLAQTHPELMPPSGGRLNKLITLTEQAQYGRPEAERKELQSQIADYRAELQAHPELMNSVANNSHKPDAGKQANPGGFKPRNSELAFAGKEAYGEMLDAMKRIGKDDLAREDLTGNKFLSAIKKQLQDELHAMVATVDPSKSQRYNKPKYTGEARAEREAALEQLASYQQLLKDGKQPVLGLTKEERATMGELAQLAKKAPEKLSADNFEELAALTERAKFGQPENTRAGLAEKIVGYKESAEQARLAAKAQMEEKIQQTSEKLPILRQDKSELPVYPLGRDEGIGNVRVKAGESMKVLGVSSDGAAQPVAVKTEKIQDPKPRAPMEAGIADSDTNKVASVPRGGAASPTAER